MTTGVSVDVKIFHWLTEEALKHQSYFNKTHKHNTILNNYINNLEGNLDHYPQQDVTVIQEFSKWVFMFALLFDGGLFSEDVHSVIIDQERISIRWKSHIHQTINLSQWNYRTRKAIDYIGHKSQGIKNSSRNLHISIPLLFNYLTYFKNDLHSKIAGFKTYFATSSTHCLISNDPSTMFMFLSALPKIDLDKFYIELSELFTENLSIDIHSNPVNIHQYFKLPSKSDLFLLEKVKLHYNLTYYSKLNNNLKDKCQKLTKSFLLGYFDHQQNKDTLIVKTKKIVTNILIPRLNLLSLVTTQFNWKKTFEKNIC